MNACLLTVSLYATPKRNTGGSITCATCLHLKAFALSTSFFFFLFFLFFLEIFSKHGIVKSLLYVWFRVTVYIIIVTWTILLDLVGLFVVKMCLHIHLQIFFFVISCLFFWGSEGKGNVSAHNKAYGPLRSDATLSRKEKKNSGCRGPHGFRVYPLPLKKQ